MQLSNSLRVHYCAIQLTISSQNQCMNRKTLSWPRASAKHTEQSQQWSGALNQSLSRIRTVIPITLQNLYVSRMSSLSHELSTHKIPPSSVHHVLIYSRNKPTNKKIDPIAWPHWSEVAEKTLINKSIQRTQTSAKAAVTLFPNVTVNVNCIFI